MVPVNEIVSSLVTWSVLDEPRSSPFVRMVGATGPLVAVLLAKFFDNDRRALVATHAAGMTAQHLLKIFVFGFAGFAFGAWLPLIAAMVLSGYLGTLYGSSLLERLPADAAVGEVPQRPAHAAHVDAVELQRL